MTFLHPKSGNLLEELREFLPDALAGYLSGLASASSVIWDQGGLAISPPSPASEAQPTDSSTPRELLLEFFSCVCGKRSLERTFEAEPALTGFELALRSAFPEGRFRLSVVTDEPSWCYELHVAVESGAASPLHFTLFWSVD